MAKAKAARKAKSKVRVADLSASKKRGTTVKGGTLNFTRFQK